MLREFSTPTMCHVSEWYFFYAVSSEFNQCVNNKPKTDQSTLCQDFWLKYLTHWTILELGQLVFYRDIYSIKDVSKGVNHVA